MRRIVPCVILLLAACGPKAEGYDPANLVVMSANRAIEVTAQGDHRLEELTKVAQQVLALLEGE